MMRFKLSAFADEASSQIGQQIAAMQKHGISYLEIRGVDGENISKISIEKAREVKKQLDDAQIQVWSLGSPYGKIKIEDDFQPHLDLYKRGLEIAHELNTEHIRIFSFYMPKECDPEIYCDQVMDRLKQFVDASRGSGITVCHENEKGIYGDIAERCLQIHKAIPEIKAVFDPANFIQCKQDTKAAWEMLSSYVEYMHIKDAMENGKVVPAGYGIGNLPYLLSQYKGSVVSIEPHLSVFKGLTELEEKDNKTVIPEYQYRNSNEAFEAAVSALKKLITQN